MSKHEIVNQGEAEQVNPSELGLSTNRIEALADGIFAVAMTLLVLDVRPPLAADKLPDWLNHEWARLYAYALSFALLGVYWVSHHAHFQYIKRVDRMLLWINIIFFLFISLVPFSASWIANSFEPGFEAQRETVLIVYGLHLIIIAALIALHWWYASRNPLFTGGRVLDRHFNNSVYRRIAFSPVLCLIAIIFSFVFPIASIVCYSLIPLIYVFPGHIDLHWKREHPNGR